MIASIEFGLEEIKDMEIIRPYYKSPWHLGIKAHLEELEPTITQASTAPI
jgi:hypothetical protein